MAFNLVPKVSSVSKGLAGKSMFFYGPNRTGKTSVASDFPQPLFLCFENGLEGLQGIEHFDITDWKFYIEIIKMLTDPKQYDELHARWKTIVVDGTDVIDQVCGRYVCTKNGLEYTGEAKKNAKGETDGRFNYYKELDLEFRKWFFPLLFGGYNTIFLGHDGGTREFKRGAQTISKIYPKGDKRIIDAICDNVSIIGYITPNGVDENGYEVPSSLYMYNNDDFIAGSHIKYLTPYLPVFSAKNLEDAIAEAVKKQEGSEGFKASTFVETRETRTEVPTSDKVTELKQKIQQIAANHIDAEKGTLDPRVTAIIDEYLGKGAKVSAATNEQYQQLELILFDLERLDTAPATKQSYEDIRNQIMEAATWLNNEERMDDYREIVEKHLGKGVKVSALGPEETDKMEAVLNDLKQVLKQLK